MGQPAAKQGDHVVAVDTHLIQPPGPVPPVPVPHPFAGLLVDGLSADVLIEGMPAAVLGSKARCTPPHIPIGGSFVSPPTNEGVIIKGSATVLINGKPAARAGDTALTCNDPAPMPVGQVVAVSTVVIGG